MILEDLARVRVLPVIEIDDATRAADLATALSLGGVPCAEVTLRTPAAPAAIEEMSRRGDFLVGAGTVLRAEQVDIAADRGAQFVVSPGFVPSVALRAHDRGVAYIPGVGTATEVLNALAAGFAVQKLFPAEQLGGADFVKAMRGPFPDVSFIPSGGLTPHNASSYDLPTVHALSTSWIASRAAIAAGKFSAIAERAQLLRDCVNA